MPHRALTPFCIRSSISGLPVGCLYGKYLHLNNGNSYRNLHWEELLL